MYIIYYNYSDLIEELRPWIQDALDLRRSDVSTSFVTIVTTTLHHL